MVRILRLKSGSGWPEFEFSEGDFEEFEGILEITFSDDQKAEIQGIINTVLCWLLDDGRAKIKPAQKHLEDMCKAIDRVIAKIEKGPDTDSRNLKLMTQYLYNESRRYPNTIPRYEHLPFMLKGIRDSLIKSSELLATDTYSTEQERLPTHTEPEGRLVRSLCNFCEDNNISISVHHDHTREKGGRKTQCVQFIDSVREKLKDLFETSDVATETIVRKRLSDQTSK